ncbi:thiamine phosphate synthase [Garciella nitratireducens]|uniref:Thiamine-phosphate synthase n=1 Tax=Garciella nitratireducens DSM 15102 TaxID=1121911 RepID=A0A1T4LBR6_9FIRM|nr:thiamine phosphate synthase [Garciella nitratireducens]RBP46738.1 thiamine-phosphate pyrophosphorylase [Garciella nitratireducens]SJZ52179.1 thiamine-phosphate pyrophosphorylase [Garciella nitratireducens DSM 15102]
MNVDRKSMLLYAITDRTWLGTHSLKEQVEQTIQAGATFVQLREKNISNEEFVKLAKEIKEVTDVYKIPFVINDNIRVAQIVDADGVHIGQEDMNVKEVRKILGEDKIIGVSAQTVEQAIQAQQEGADYIGTGAVFPTSTKKDADIISLDILKKICQRVSIPVVAIGGINESNVMKLKDIGISGISVISAIFSKPDIYSATKNLRMLSEQIVEE